MAITVVRKSIAVSRNITAIAGDGTGAYGGDGGAATGSASESSLRRRAWIPRGNLYIADRDNNVIRKVDLSRGTSTRLPVNQAAGCGIQRRQWRGDGAQLSGPIADRHRPGGRSCTLPITSTTCYGRSISQGVITTVAGNFLAGFRL